MKYRKKPVIVEAVVWDGSNYQSIQELAEYRPGILSQFGSELGISTLEGVMKSQPGDFIIKGVKGELYPCKPDIFAATYEVVE